MPTIQTNTQINSDRKLSIELPDNFPLGDYEVLIILNPKEDKEQPNESQTMTNAWDNWVKEVKKLSPRPRSEPKNYQQHLLEKYRKQGLDQFRLVKNSSI